MEIIFEVLFQFVGEFLIQIVFEILTELGLHSTREVFKRPPNPFFATIGYSILGAIAAGFSLWWHPEHFTRTMELRIAVLVVVPVAAGATMALMGAWRRRRDQPLIRLDRFVYGYVFALTMGGIRFMWAQ